MALEYNNFAPHFLWFLNHRLHDDELIRQLKAMKHKGYGGFFMHWLYGGEPYMGERWLQMLDVIVEQSSVMGLNAWLYDEGWCPSGFAGGRILAMNPDLSVHTLWYKRLDVAGGQEINCDFDLMKPLGVLAFPVENGVPCQQEVVRLDATLGTVMHGDRAPYEHDWGYYPHAELRRHWRVRTHGLSQWRFGWRAPAGAWRVFIICARNRFVWDKVNRVDPLNQKATSHFIRETHGAYAARYSNYFGNTIPGIMTDEPKYLPLAWTDGLPEVYQQRYQAELTEQLPLLFDDSFAGAGAFRSRFYKLLGDLFFENFITPMADWCEENGLILTGHISPEEDPSHECDLIGSLGKDLSRFGIPGTDLIIQAVGNRQRPALNLGPRVASSVAHQQGIKRVFVEVGACCKEDLSFQELKHMCDWLIINGVNMITIHGLAYSLEQERKFLTDQNFAVDNNLWPRSDTLVNYLEATCRLTSEYRPKPKVGVLKPQTSIRYQTNIDEETFAILDDERERNDENLIAVVQHLLQNHIDFDILDEDTADCWQVVENRLQLEKASYHVLVIPECEVISEQAEDCLVHFAEHVICQNRCPQVVAESDVRDCRLEFRACAMDELSTELRRCLPALPALNGELAEDVYLYHGFSDAGEERLLLLNLLEQDNDVKLELNGRHSEIVLAPFECRVVDPVDRVCTKAVTQEVALAVGTWRVSSTAINHVPVVPSPCKVVVNEGAAIRGLIMERAEINAFSKTLRINGEKPDFATIADFRFYTSENVLLPVDLMNSPGEYLIEFDEDESFLTLLLAGQFAVEAMDENIIVVGPVKTETADVSRLGAGYPYLHGEVCFEADFSVKEDLPEGTVLVLPGRKGVVTVTMDGVEIGSVGWCPDEIEVGPVKAGQHHLKLQVLGDGIGILRHPASEAGLSGTPYFITRNDNEN